jgi:hypothetical protein
MSGGSKTDLKEFDKKTGEALLKTAGMFFEFEPKVALGFWDEMVPGWGLERRWQNEEAKVEPTPAPAPVKEKAPKETADPLGPKNSEYLRKACLDRYNMADGGFVHPVDNQYWNIHEGRGARPVMPQQNPFVRAKTHQNAAGQTFCSSCERILSQPHSDKECIFNLRNDVADLKKKAQYLKQQLRSLTEE